jgi:Divergent InlB B-repeat domain
VSFIAEGPGSVSGIRTQEAGTRGSATATPAPGAQFLSWAASSSDCPGETTNPCSFMYAPTTKLVAQFAASAPPAPVITAPRIDCVQEFVHHWNSGTDDYISPIARQVCPVPKMDGDCASDYAARNLYNSSARRKACAIW